MGNVGLTPIPTGSFAFVVVAYVTQQTINAGMRRDNYSIVPSHWGMKGKLQCAKEGGKLRLKLILGLAGGVLGPLVLVLVVLYCLRRKLSFRSILFWKTQNQNHKNLEAFLRNYGPLQVTRYSYLDVKKMTNSFEEKLGQGGFGGVYKGKVKDGPLVAVKVLNRPKGNGEDFLNEVAAISRTSHVNIVGLLGFCFEGSKRALIYEFMPNGSLEKFIFDANNLQNEHHLGWEALEQISLGIARGLEYLHRGCNTRILHFDIKPHNILLDENFSPKISVFSMSSKPWQGHFRCSDCRNKKDAMEGKRPSGVRVV